jgi:adenylate cyclase
MRFGDFAVDKEGDVLFKYAPVGSAIDKEELKAVAMAVLTTADEYDDQIISRFGGAQRKGSFVAQLVTLPRR